MEDRELVALMAAIIMPGLTARISDTELCADRAVYLAKRILDTVEMGQPIGTK